MRGYFCIGFIDFMFKDKSRTDFTNLSSLHNFDEEILYYFLKWNINMSGPTFLELDNPLQFRLGKIKEIENIFIAEISNREALVSIVPHLTGGACESLQYHYIGKIFLIHTDIGRKRPWYQHRHI